MMLQYMYAHPDQSVDSSSDYLSHNKTKQLTIPLQQCLEVKQKLIKTDICSNEISKRWLCLSVLSERREEAGTFGYA